MGTIYLHLLKEKVLVGLTSPYISSSPSIKDNLSSTVESRTMIVLCRHYRTIFTFETLSEGNDLHVIVEIESGL